MKEIHAKDTADLNAQIRALSGEKRVHISLRPTMKIIFALEKKCPELEELSCPMSLYLQVAKKVFRYCEAKKIKLTASGEGAGRPREHDEHTVKEIIRLRTSGRTAKQVSEEMLVPLRTVYFYLKEEADGQREAKCEWKKK